MNGDRALLERIRKQEQLITVVLSKVGTKAYTVEQLFKSLGHTKLKATLGVEKEHMHLKLTIPKGMKTMVWLHEVQSFVADLRKERYQTMKEKTTQ